MSVPDADPAAEPVAVYDAAGAVVGVATRGEVYAQSLWHGVGGVLLRSGDGSRVYVHRRTATKLVMPGLYDCWAAGSSGPVRTRRAPQRGSWPRSWVSPVCR